MMPPPSHAALAYAKRRSRDLCFGVGVGVGAPETDRMAVPLGRPWALKKELARGVVGGVVRDRWGGGLIKARLCARAATCCLHIGVGLNKLMGDV